MGLTEEDHKLLLYYGPQDVTDTLQHRAQAAINYLEVARAPKVIRGVVEDLVAEVVRLRERETHLIRACNIELEKRRAAEQRS